MQGTEHLLPEQAGALLLRRLQGSIVSGEISHYELKGMHPTGHEISVALQKLRALLKPSSAAAQKMHEATRPSSNGNAAEEQTVSQAFAVRACSASGWQSGLNEYSQLQ